MSASFLGLGVILGGIGMLLFLILSIIALANGHKKNIIVFSTSFLVCLIITVMSAMEASSRIGNKISNEMQKALREEANNWEEERLAEDDERAAYISWLKSIAPDEYRDSLQGYFSSFDTEKNVYCIPMVYPYRLEMDDPNDSHARLSAVNGKKPQDIDKLAAITKLSFDEKMMIAKRDLSGYIGRIPDGLPEVSYIIFEFKTGKVKVFLNHQEVTTEATKMGFSGSMDLEGIYDHYKKL
jgi:hypothetical protein